MVCGHYPIACAHCVHLLRSDSASQPHIRAQQSIDSVIDHRSNVWIVVSFLSVRFISLIVRSGRAQSDVVAVNSHANTVNTASSTSVKPVRPSLPYELCRYDNHMNNISDLMILTFIHSINAFIIIILSSLLLYAQ